MDIEFKKLKNPTNRPIPVTKDRGRGNKNIFIVGLTLKVSALIVHS